MIEITNLTKIFPARRDDETEIKIGYSALRISLPLFIAVEKKLFAKEKLHVKLERFDTAQPLMNALLDGNIQAGGYSALPISFQGMVEKGTGLYFITSLIEDDTHRISYFLTRSQNALHGDWEAVRGKRIGILPTVAYRVWLEAILQKKGILSEEVHIIPIEPIAQSTALQDNTVDFLFTNDPVATTIIRHKIGTLFSNEVDVPQAIGTPFLFGSFNIRKDFADANPGISRKLVAVLDKAVEYVNKNPASAKRMMRKYIHESQRAFVDFYPDALYQPTTETDVKTFQDIANFYYQSHVVRKRLDLKDLLASEDHFSSHPSIPKGQHVFTNLSLKIRKNEIVGLFGPNGAGKSTLFNILAGLDQDYMGQCVLSSKMIAYVHQKPLATLLPWYHCKDNILLAREYRGLDRRTGEDLLDYFNKKLGIDFSLYSYLFELSGGQQQIVAILRALITEPEIVLLDEPFSALDVGKRADVIRVLSKQCTQGTTVVISSHRGDEVKHLITRAITFGGSPVKIENDMSIGDFHSRREFEEAISKIRFRKYGNEI